MNKELRENKLSIWHDAIIQAEKKSGQKIEDCLRHYLIITLDHFTLETNINSHIICVDFLSHSHAKTNFDISCLRSTGDLCLILSGLFPESVKHKNITTDYVITLGQQAYDIISCANTHPLLSSSLFKKLRDNFPNLSQTLNYLRN